MFLVELPDAEPEPESKKVGRDSSARSTAVYQAARWIRRFHHLSHIHIGFMDHTPTVTDIEVLNGYSDGMEPRLLYRDPAYPEKQFLIRYTKLKERMRSGLLLYVNCDSFPKPCAHVASSRKTLKSL